MVRVKCFPISVNSDSELISWAETLYHVQFELDEGDWWLIFESEEDAVMFKLKFGHLLPND